FTASLADLPTLNLIAMKATKNLLRISFVAIIIFLTACEKLIDFIPAKAKNCRIKKIHFIFPDFGGFNSNYDMDFYYNKWGNPDSIIISRPLTANYNRYFLYDNKKQLKRLVEAQDFKFPVLDHRFGYTRDLITSDTTHSAYGVHAVTSFEYDGHGRISKSTFNFLPPDPYVSVTQTFQYDSEGNLLNGIGNYDNKLNPNQLHPIWLFLVRNYSLNNPIHAVQYNSFRLPTKLAEPGSTRLEFLGGGFNFLDNSEIEYDCKGDNR